LEFCNGSADGVEGGRDVLGFTEDDLFEEFGGGVGGLFSAAREFGSEGGLQGELVRESRKIGMEVSQPREVAGIDKEDGGRETFGRG
jgi:hypothetical protein